MNTYLPYPNFLASARCLDNRRLCAMIKEGWQIYRANELGGKHQGNPHAYAMWRGHAGALLQYILTLYREWRRRYDAGERGGKREHASGEAAILEALRRTFSYAESCGPSWLFRPQFCASHRAALIYKSPEHYGQFGWTESPAVPNERGSLPYVWPV